MQKGSTRSEESIRKFMKTTVQKWLSEVDDDELLRFFDLCMKDRIIRAQRVRKEREMSTINILKDK
jgi:hypothetical protein